MEESKRSNPVGSHGRAPCVAGRDLRRWRCAVALVVLIWAGMAHQADAASQVTGTWLAANGLELASAELDGKSQTVCLPKLDFSEPPNRADLRDRLRETIKSQKAVFHLYTDDLGRPIRKGGKVFASDVFFTELKMTWVALLRQLGCRFTVSRQPAHLDDAYLRAIDQMGSGGPAATGGGSGSGSGAGSGSGSGSGSPGGDGRMTSAADPFARVTTSFDSLPSRVLPPSVRRHREEIAKRVLAVKSKPYRSSPLKVDGIRWASGRMGRLQAVGLIHQAEIEGQKADMVVPVPAGTGWWSAKLAGELAGQPCEFILQRNLDGAELKKNGQLVLVDFYLSDLGLSWPEWLTERGLATPAAPLRDPEMATGPITLTVQVVEAVWVGVAGSREVKLRFPTPPPGVAPEETVRALPERRTVGWTAEIGQRLDRRLAGQPVSVSLLRSPRGVFYTEMGRKKAHQLFFPKLETNLDRVLDALLDPDR